MNSWPPSAATAADPLGLGRTRFYELYGDYLRAAARQQAQLWTPGSSGGDHAPVWPSGVEPLLRKRLATQPPARFVAPLAMPENRRALATRRHAPPRVPLLDLLDDCSRVCTGATIYHGEDLLAYFDFLPAAFTEHGLPLQLYVDCHSFFFPRRPDALTQLGAALHFYGVSLRYARTPLGALHLECAHRPQSRSRPTGACPSATNAGAWA